MFDHEIFTRLRIAACNRLGGVSICRNTPSIRYRTRNVRSIGSRWISDARILQASVMIMLTRRITGASESSDSCPVSLFAFSATSISLSDMATVKCSQNDFRIQPVDPAARTSARGATTASTFILSTYRRLSTVS